MNHIEDENSAREMTRASSPASDGRPSVAIYEITVDGYGPVHYSARKPSKARAAAYRDFTDVWTCTFRDFISRSRIRRVANQGRIGERMLVCGRPATRCIGRTGMYGSGNFFMWDDSDEIMTCHDTEITPIPRAPIGYPSFSSGKSPAPQASVERQRSET